MKAEESQAGILGKTMESLSAERAELNSDVKIKMPLMPCAQTVEHVFNIPANALLSRLKVRITAMPAGTCALNDAGEVRISQGDGKKVIIDLKRMRSVSGLKAPQNITDIDTWTGAEFTQSAIKGISRKTVLFSDVATERLQVTFDADADLETFLEDGLIILPDLPADLILSVNDKTAWTHLGPVTLSSPEKVTKNRSVSLDEKAGNEWLGVLDSPCFIEDIDITTLLQGEINAGAKELKVVLGSAFACRLTLKVTVEEYLLSHDVVFPAQAQVLEITQEGITTLSLPLPGASNSWRVKSVFFTFQGNPGPSRFFPAVGPQPIQLGDLLLDSDHALAAALTETGLNKFKIIEGVRLPLQVEKGGAEITAFFRRDDDGKVGDYLDGGALQSKTIDHTGEQWVLLELSNPVDIQPNTRFWLEINVIRGKCWWQLGNKTDPSAGVVELHRGIPGGTFSPFSLTLNGQPEHLMGRLRLKGQPVTDGAVYAVVPLDPESGDELGGICVGKAPSPVELQFNNTVRPVKGALNLDLQVHGPGTYTVTKARVLYELES